MGLGVGVHMNRFARSLLLTLALTLGCSLAASGKPNHASAANLSTGAEVQVKLPSGRSLSAINACNVDSRGNVVVAATLPGRKDWPLMTTAVNARGKVVSRWRRVRGAVSSGGILQLAGGGLLIGHSNAKSWKRVDRRGRIDRTFGSKGIVRSLRASTAFVTTEGGFLLRSASESGIGSTLRAFSPKGKIQRDFGKNGELTLPAEADDQVLTDGGEKLVVYGHRSATGSAEIRVFRPDGSQVESFGENGRVSLAVPGSTVSVSEAAFKGSFLYFIERVQTPVKDAQGNPTRAWNAKYSLLRLNSSGAVIARLPVFDEFNEGASLPGGPGLIHRMILQVKRSGVLFGLSQTYFFDELLPGGDLPVSQMEMLRLPFSLLDPTGASFHVGDRRKGGTVFVTQQVAVAADGRHAILCGIRARKPYDLKTRLVLLRKRL